MKNKLFSENMMNNKRLIFSSDKFFYNVHKFDLGTIHK
jgi:hypothetical protein